MLAATRALAARKGLSVGRVLSDLVRRRIRTGTAVAQRTRGRAAVSAVGPDAGPITNEDIRRSLSDWP